MFCKPFCLVPLVLQDKRSCQFFVYIFGAQSKVLNQPSFFAHHFLAQAFKMAKRISLPLKRKIRARNKCRQQYFCQKFVFFDRGRKNSQKL